MRTILHALTIWGPFPLNAAVNLRRGYTLRQTLLLHRISWRLRAATWTYDRRES